MKSVYRIFMSLLVIFVFTNFSSQESQPKSPDQDVNLVLKGKKGHPVPIKGSFNVGGASTGPGSHPIYIQGTGNVSHLGRTKVNLGNTFIFSPPPPFSATGNLVLTAANGDQLKGSFTGEMTPTGSTTSSVLFTGSFNGGTGRFAGADGSFTWRGTYDRSTHTGKAKFTGTIIY